MKKISIALLAIILATSCTKEHSGNYITFSGKLENNTDSILTISDRDNTVKTITIQKDGTFNDTLKVAKATMYTLQSSARKRAPLFLKNGYNLQLTGDLSNFLEKITYKGKGSESNNFILARFKIGSTLNPTELFALNKEDFDKKVTKLERRFDSIQQKYTQIDSTLAADSKKQNEQLLTGMKSNYEQQHKIAIENLNSMKVLAKGNPSPKFTNYQNFNGKKTSLDQLKGKFVYIDVWATWCRPCLAEIPSLKELEKKYHGKSIQFVSISIDNKRTAGSWENAEKKWKNMVADKNLTGIQLYAGEDADFIKAYQINSIPRFILIDPKGNIVDANAPRPSDSELVALFTELGI